MDADATLQTTKHSSYNIAHQNTKDQFQRFVFPSTSTNTSDVIPPRLYIQTNKSLHLKEDLAEGSVELPDEPESYSPRKPIPVQWGPNLQTAQRAQMRTQKKTGDSPIESGRKTIRGARSAVDLKRANGAEAAGFLTKSAGVPVETNLNSPISLRAPGKLRHTASKPSTKSPLASPTHSPTVKITMSPSRSPRVSHNDSSGHINSSRPVAQKGTHSSVSSNEGGSIYVTANQSPTTALQSVTKSRLPLQHSRGKSEPYLRDLPSAKLTLTRLATPKLALRIPRSNASTDRKPSLVANNACLTSLESPTSPLQASRIPLSLPSAKNVQEKGGAKASPPLLTTINRLRPAKCGLFNKTTKPHGAAEETDQDSSQILFSNHTNDSDVYGSLIEAANKFSLPETPKAPKRRHVRTMNSSGRTPIISRESSDDRTANTSTLSKSKSRRQGNVTSNTDVMNDQVDEHAILESYLTQSILPDERVKDTAAKNIDLSTVGQLGTAKTRSISDVTTSSQATRVTSLASNNTVRGARCVVTGEGSSDRKDSAIVHNRRKSDASGPSYSEQPDCDESTSTASASPSSVFRSVTDCQDSISESDTKNDSLRQHIHSESSLSNLPSDLRATAPEFIPSLSSQETNMPVTEQYEQSGGVYLGNPFLLDSSGIPMYYRWYYIPFADGFPFDFTNFMPRFSSTRKNKNRAWKKFKQYSPQKPRKEVETSATSKTISNRQADDSPVSVVPSGSPDPVMNTPSDTTVTEDPSVEKFATDAIHDNEAFNAPFADQMRAVQSHSDLGHTNAEDQPKERFDWSEISNVPSRSQNLQTGLHASHTHQNNPYLSGQDPFGSIRSGHYTLPHRGRFAHYQRGYQARYPNNGLYDNYAGPSRSRYGGPSAGVPLHQTAPFPSPAPPGRPVMSNFSKDSVGFLEGNDCGLIQIESAVEIAHPTRLCDSCVSDH
ncbi:hypothetical protein B0J11DRAFT_50078 [Dendryphion nanum]|uniref:Uncharacterized protein n=1 Tax=Dendryphion nanum TaxID=256645 RepID=A0A9P9IIK0_9PLEO|nr:hypothetical protein B0J11DRAFT_50078 [Dendryphion nanum]